MQNVKVPERKSIVIANNYVGKLRLSSEKNFNSDSRYAGKVEVRER